MAGNAQLSIAIRAVNLASAQLREIEKDFEGMGKEAEASSAKATKGLDSIRNVAGGILAADAIKGLGSSLKSAFGSAIEGATNLELSAKKSGIVFGDQIGTVDKWAKANASAMGLTSREATGLAASMADLLIPMGMSREEAVKMSTETVGLAGALAEWSGGTKTAAEVSDILTKAMLGETDGLKALGISISAADISAQLALKGQQDLTGAAREQAEALAVQELIFAKSTDAQNAYAEGGNSAARAQAELSAKQKELSETMQSALLPALTAGLTAFMALPEPIQILGAGLAQAMPIIGQFGVAMAAIGPTILKVIPMIYAKAAAWTAAAAAMIAANAPIILVTLAVAAVAAGLIYFFTQTEIGQKILAAFTTFIKNDVIPALKSFSDFFTGTLLPVIKTAIEIYLTPLKLAVELIATVTKETVGIIVDLIQGDFDGAWEKAKNILTAFETFFSGIMENVKELLGALGPALLALGKAAMTALWNGADAVWTDNIKPWLKSIPGAVVAEIGDLAKTLWNAGGALIDGFFDGLRNNFWAAIESVKKLIDPRNWDIPELSPFVPAMKHAGELGGGSFIDGLVQSISAGAAEVNSAFTNILGGASTAPFGTQNPFTVPDNTPKGAAPGSYADAGGGAYNPGGSQMYTDAAGIPWQMDQTHDAATKAAITARDSVGITNIYITAMDAAGIRASLDSGLGEEIIAYADRRRTY